MKAAWLVIWVIVAVVPAKAQDKAAVGDFTKSPTEHIISQLDQPFVVRSLQGIVSRKEGYQEPLPNVLFEIQGPGTGRKIRRATTDDHGRFKIGHVPAGTYKFKATLNGFQSVMGTITLSKKATTGNEIRLEMQVGV
ncbi:MAG TPA: carboxypeptidase-like regulatory domain-containing protein [Candidatus Acidoferrum sp.]|nr:carboxypeptidase-like regulatory domain-containing protein [Candidatus Acidoferrum sp.]